MSIPLRLAIVVASAVCLLSPRQASADSISFSQSFIQDSSFNPFSNNGTTSSSLTVGHDSASSFIDLATSRMGASINAPDVLPQLRTSTEHHDDWFCAPGTGCDGLLDPSLLHMGLTVHFDAALQLASANEMSFEASYRLSGGQQFSIGFFQDPTFEGGAQFTDGGNSEDVPLVMSVDAQGITHISVDFSTTFAVRCPNGCTDSDPTFTPFSDVQRISAELEGAGNIDAGHTFQVTLTPLDPGISLVSGDGRTASSAPVTNPVPEPATLLLLGSGLLGVVARGRRRFEH
jgi:hypothetical protein